MSSQSATGALEQEAVGTLLLRYSAPAITGMVAFSLYNIIAGIFIGQGIGAIAISALAVAFPVMNLTFAFGLLVGIGGASICSIRLGQKNLYGAEEVLGHVVVLNLIVGIVFALVSLAVLRPALVLFGASPDTLEPAVDFMRIILLGLPIAYTLFNLNHIMRASGYPTRAMLSILLTVAANIVFTPLFIFAFGWGMAGAALATVLSQTVGMIWVIAHFRRRESSLRFRPGIYHLRRETVLSLFSIGLSPFLINVCACAVVVFINIGLREQGGDLAIGAYGIVNRVLILFVMMVMGLAQGMQPIVGYNYGAGHLHRVRHALHISALAATLITTSGFLAGFFCPEHIAELFTPDAELIELSANGMRLSTLAFILVGSQVVLINFFQSIGKAKVAIFLSLTRQLIFLIPGIVVLPRFLGLDGIWLSLPIADVLAFVTAIAVFFLCLKEIRHHHP